MKSTATDLVTVPRDLRRPGLPIAQMRSVYRVGDVERRLEKLPNKEHENLRATYERMLEKGPERFQVKPSGLPAMEQLYEDLPNFHDVLDDVKRQLALCTDSRDALEITPMLLLGPPGVGKTLFAREIALLLGTGMGFLSMSSLTAGWVLSGASSASARMARLPSVSAAACSAFRIGTPAPASIANVPAKRAATTRRALPARWPCWPAPACRS